MTTNERYTALLSDLRGMQIEWRVVDPDDPGFTSGRTQCADQLLVRLSQESEQERQDSSARMQTDQPIDSLTAPTNRVTSMKGPNTMLPTIGRIVLYTLNEDDAAQITRRRTTDHSIAERMKIQVSQVESMQPLTAWPAGAQAHIGNDVKAGNVYPMMIVAVWGDTETSAVNGQVFLDGSDVFWATSVSVGTGPRTWAWPTRA